MLNPCRCAELALQEEGVHTHACTNRTADDANHAPPNDERVLNSRSCTSQQNPPKKVGEGEGTRKIPETLHQPNPQKQTIKEEGAGED